MYPSTPIPDSLRLRYRQPVTHVSRPTPRLSNELRRPAQPVVAQTPQPVVALQPQQPTAAHDTFSVNLNDVSAAPIKRSRYLVKPRRGMQFALLAMSISLFAVGGYISLQGAQSNKAVGAALTEINDSSSQNNAVTDAPAIDKPNSNAVASYTVAADMPRYIRIPSLGTQARVKNMGTTKDGAIAAPGNVHDAGWFNGSAKPGTPGAAVIDGHVSSWKTNGVFHNLKSVQVGAIVEVEQGNGNKLSYKVVKTQVYNADAVDMKAVSVPAVGTEGLNLITCTGKVKKGTSEFDQRLVVFTQRV